MKDVDASRPASVFDALLTRLESTEAHQLSPGDLVLKARGNTHCAVIENTPNDRPLVAAAPLFVLRPNPEIVNPAYLRWYLNHPSTQARLAAAAVGTYVPTVSKSTIENLEIDLPSLETQALTVTIAALADSECRLLEAISNKRRDATNQRLLRLCRTSGDARKQGGRRGAGTPRLPDHEQH